MKIDKAIKHLKRAQEHLEYLRNSYVENERDTNLNIDIELNYFFRTIRQTRRLDIIEDMRKTKERIAKFQRIVL